MDRAIYKNKMTKRKLCIVQRRDGKIQVKYLLSGSMFWYSEAEFETLFELT